MGQVNVAVIAPILGRDLSFVGDIEPRVRVLDANFAASGRRAGAGGPAAHDPVLLADILAQAEVLLVGTRFLRVSPPALPAWCGRITPRPASRTWPGLTCRARTSPSPAAVA